MHTDAPPQPIAFDNTLDTYGFAEGLTKADIPETQARALVDNFQKVNLNNCDEAICWKSKRSCGSKCNACQ